MRRTLRWPPFLLAVLAFFPAGPVEAQGVLVPLYTRDAATLQRNRAARLDGEANALADGPRKTELQDKADNERSRTYTGFTRVTDLEAAAMWGSPRAALLPAARVSPGTDRTALYTELGQAVSGGWRFVLATALAVETDTDDEEGEPAAQQAGEETEDDPSTGFRRFVSGGGNLSLAAMRPVAMRTGGTSDHVVVALPRAWANIPTLSDADGVEDFGGEVAAEYSYLRYARPMTTAGTLAAKPELPFLMLQVRTGAVMGTSSFYRTIGHADRNAFLYTVPSLNLQFENGVKLGVSYFWGFGDFSEHENLRFHVTLAPPRPRA